MNDRILISPVGHVYNSRTTLIDDHWGGIISKIILDDPFSEDCFEEIDTFSHAEIVFYFDQLESDQKYFTSRHPRGNSDWPKVGIFAQRNKDRPNRIGLTIVRIIQRDGRCLIVQGLDAMNGTPVLDIKPVMIEFLPQGPVFQPQWSHKLMMEYWKQDS